MRESGGWHVGLLHERLAIIDLTATGSQPMRSDDGLHWLSYNGEVYNFVEIRAELTALGCHFSGTSDSEVVLAALQTWGDKAMTRFNGMWAFAWLDLGRRRLILSRDRLGVKPLYYRLGPAGLQFGSEIKAVLELVGDSLRLNPMSVGAYVHQSLLDSSPQTFFQGVVKVPAGSFCSFDLSRDELVCVCQQFWAPSRVESVLSYSDAAEQIRSLLIDSVRIRLRSDVPVGVLLSGGVDSSAIAGSMDALLGHGADLNLLSAVSDGGRFDESPFIDTMARHLGRTPHKVKVELDPVSALHSLEQVCWFNDEPVGSFSNVAHFMLMKRANELGIKVILSGQGADEIFCGYKKFVGFYIQSLLRGGHPLRAMHVAQQFLSRGTVINQFSLHEAKRYLPSVFRSRALSAVGPALRGYSYQQVGLDRSADVRDRQIADLTQYSVPVLTHYEDRMSMAWGREIRTPFLDYRLVETALSLPTEAKLRGGWTKRALRDAIRGLVPESIAWRKDKQGFVNPQSEWLKTELRTVVTDILNGPSRIFELGFFDRKNLLSLYERYRKQHVNRGSVSFKEIFQPVALEVWLRAYWRYIAA